MKHPYIIPVKVFEGASPGFGGAWIGREYVILAKNKLMAILGLKKHPLFVEDNLEADFPELGRFSFDSF